MKVTNKIIILSLLSVWGCKDKIQEKAVEENTQTEQIFSLTAAQMKQMNLKWDTLTRRNVNTIVKLSGKIDVPPQNLISISVSMGGFLKSTELLPGVPVQKGQILAVMEDQQYIQLQQDYFNTRTQLELKEKEYNRQKTLQTQNAGTEKVVEMAKADYLTQKVNFNALAEKLRLIGLDPNKLSENNFSRQIYLRSPINGFVSKINVNAGKYINSGETLFELVDPSDIHLNLTVFEKDLDKIRIGQKLVAFTNHAPNVKYACDVVLINQSLTDDHTSEIHCHFEKYDRSLIPGMYMNAELKVLSDLTYAVPEDAIVGFQGKDFIVVRESENSFSLKEVIIGVTENGYTAISGIEPGNKTNIVTHGAYEILMAMNKEAE